MAHRVDGVLVGYPIATPSLRISTRVPRDQRTPGPNSLGPVCPVPTVPSTARGMNASAAGAGTAYAAGGHSAELDYTGPELAHSAELDYQSPV